MRHGKGTLTESSGIVYVGMWSMSQRDGRGAQTWKNGDKYVKSYHLYFKAVTMNVCVCIRYEGQFSNDKMNGQVYYLNPMFVIHVF